MLNMTSLQILVYSLQHLIKTPRKRNGSPRLFGAKCRASSSPGCFRALSLQDPHSLHAPKGAFWFEQVGVGLILELVWTGRLAQKAKGHQKGPEIRRLGF